MDAEKRDGWLKFLESHVELVDDDNWNAVYRKVHDSRGELTTYLHDLGFDPLPYMTYIGREMYDNCVWLENIVIPNSISTIQRDAFNGCANLKKVEILGVIDKIDNYAFDKCYNLSEIIYHGSKNEQLEHILNFVSNVDKITYVR